MDRPGSDDHRVVPAATADERRATTLVLGIGGASAVLYAVTYVTQRGIYLNGFDVDFRGRAAAGYAGDGALLAAQLAVYVCVAAALFGLFGWLLLACRRGRLVGRRARGLAIAIPVMINVALLFGRPYLSSDTHSYAAHGYLGNLPGGNPYTRPTREAADTALAPQLAAVGWRPVHEASPYGPVWTRLELWTTRLTTHVTTGASILRAVAVAASLASAALIWFILGRIRPRAQLLGTLVYLWNPLIIIEFAAEGHNDALMILFALGGVALCVLRRPVTSVLSTALGVLTKVLPAVLAPAQVALLWRRATDRRKLVLHLLAGVVAASLVAVLLYGRLWAGTDTFAGIAHAGSPNRSCTVAGGVYAALAFVIPRSAAGALVTTATTLLLVAVMACASWHARDERSLVEACAYTALSFVYLVSMRYFPWYAGLSLALMALSPTKRFLFATLVISVCGRLAAPVCAITDNGHITWRLGEQILTGVGSGLVAAVLVATWCWPSKRPDSVPQMHMGVGARP